jgi:hypothetical protein
MADCGGARARTARLLGVVSLTLGLLGLGARLALEASRADLGSDLGIDTAGFRLAFFWGALGAAANGAVGALAAFFAALSWRARVGVSLPGFLANGFTFFLFAVL